MRVSMLTTTDNPYSPHDDFDRWRAFDDQAGYHSCEYLARVAYTSDEMSDEDEARVIEEAIDEIVALNASGVHIKVVKDMPEEG